MSGSQYTARAEEEGAKELRNRQRFYTAWFGENNVALGVFNT